MRARLYGLVVAILAALSLLLGLAARCVAAVAVEHGGTLTVLQSVPTDPLLVSSSLYAFFGSPATGFSTPQIISEPGDAIDDVSELADSAGDVLAVWESYRSYIDYSSQYPYSSSISRGVWYAWRPAGASSFQSPAPLLPPGPVSLIKLVMNKRGEAAAAYSEGPSIYVRRFTAAGMFGTPLLIATDAGPDPEGAVTLRGVGITESGELIAVSTIKHLVQARFAAPGQSFGSPQTLTTGAVPDWEEPSPAMASNGSGAAALLLHADDRIQAAYRLPGQRFGKLQPISPVTTTETRTAAVSLSIDPQGRATAAIELWNHDVPNDPHELQVSQSTATGSFSAPTFIESRPQSDNFLPAPGKGVGLLAGADEGAALITYTEGTQNQPFATQIRLSSKGGPFGAPGTIEEGTPGSQSSCGVPVPASQGPPPQYFANFTQAEDGGFYALQTLDEPGCSTEPKLLPRYFVKIQHHGADGAAKPVNVPLPPTPYTSATQPAAELAIGHTAEVRLDQHGYLQGELGCGADWRDTCQTTLTLIAPGRPTRAIAERHITLSGATKGISVQIKLPTKIRHKIDRDGRFIATITLSTLGKEAPPTISEYPITILPAPRLRARHHHTHRARRNHRRRRATHAR